MPYPNQCTRCRCYLQGVQYFPELTSKLDKHDLSAIPSADPSLMSFRKSIQRSIGVGTPRQGTPRQQWDQQEEVQTPMSQSRPTYREFGTSPFRYVEENSGAGGDFTPRSRSRSRPTSRRGSRQTSRRGSRQTSRSRSRPTTRSRSRPRSRRASASDISRTTPLRSRSDPRTRPRYSPRVAALSPRNETSSGYVNVNAAAPPLHNIPPSSTVSQGAISPNELLTRQLLDQLNVQMYMMNDELVVRADLDDQVAELLREPYVIMGSEQTIKCL